MRGTSVGQGWGVFERGSEGGMQQGWCRDQGGGEQEQRGGGGL